MKIDKRGLTAYHFIRRQIFQHPRILKPRIAMTLVTRNEGDLLEKFLKYHKSIGLEYISIIDNGSTDNTEEISLQFRNEGFVRDYIKIDGPYDQVRFVNYLNEIIKGRGDADWVINSDTDEFWMPSKSSIQDIFSERTENVFRVQSYNFLPIQEAIFYKTPYKVLQYDPSKLNTIFSPNLPKVAYRVNDFQEIFEGNHGVKVHNKSLIDTEELEIFHFPIRSETQLRSKYEALLRRTDKNFPAHVKAFGEKISKGFSYEDMFALSFPDQETIATLLNNKTVVEDTRLIQVIENVG